MSASVLAKKRMSGFWFQLRTFVANKLDDRKPLGDTAALDGVRACAFLIILNYHMMLMDLHTGLWTRGHFSLIDALDASGHNGVTLFFVLSGFLLFLPYAKALLWCKSWPEAKTFYMRRIFRIFPGYFFALFLLILLKAPSFLQPHNWPTLLQFLTFTMDFNVSQRLDGPLWTLAIECQYYLMLPLLALGIFALTRLARPEKRLWVVTGCLLALVAWGMALSFIVHPPVPLPVSPSSLGMFFTLVYGDRGKFPEDFAVGMLAATLYIYFTSAPKKEACAAFLRRLSPFLGVGALALLVYTAMRVYDPSPTFSWPVLPGLFHFIPWGFDIEVDFALGYGAFMLAVLFARPGGWFRRVFEWKPLRWLGAMSFGLYIWHVLFISVLQENVVPSLHQVNHYVAIALAWLLLLICLLPFCFFVYVVIEKPGMQFSEQLRQHWAQARRPRAPERTEQTPLAPPQAPDQRSYAASTSQNVPSERATPLPATPRSDQEAREPVPAGSLSRSRQHLQPLADEEARERW